MVIFGDEPDQWIEKCNAQPHVAQSLGVNTIFLLLNVVGRTLKGDG